MGATAWFGVFGAGLGALGVAMGAFGAHGLRGEVEPRMLEIWATATRYQVWHALALLAVFLRLTHVDRPTRAMKMAGWLFLVGVILFSGSLYTLVLSGQQWLGAITPIGGAALISGWIAFAVALRP